MRVDFFGVAMDQIANYMAKTRYLSGGRRALPVTLMTAIGNPLRQGALHAQTIYSIFAHFPGLKVVIPSTPYDAKGLMTSAIRSDDPVLYFYHSGLMGLSWGPGIEEYTAKELPADTYEIQLGRADIKKQGSDITVASVSLMVHEALRAAKSLAAEGIDVEVLDLRGLVPLDLETLEASLNRTRRLLVVDEDYLRFGMTAEIIACAIELVGNKLLTPPRRLARVQAPPPFSRVLEEYATPSAGKIVEAIRQMVNSA
jgi:pyruvate dehydrogenase E1 component beta subunit